MCNAEVMTSRVHGTDEPGSDKTRREVTRTSRLPGWRSHGL